MHTREHYMPIISAINVGTHYYQFRPDDRMYFLYAPNIYRNRNTIFFLLFRSSFMF